MFFVRARFGKHRKAMDERLPAKTAEELHKERTAAQNKNSGALTKEEQEK